MITREEAEILRKEANQKHYRRIAELEERAQKFDLEPALKVIEAKIRDCASNRTTKCYVPVGPLDLDFPPELNRALLNRVIRELRDCGFEAESDRLSDGTQSHQIISIWWAKS